MEEVENNNNIIIHNHVLWHPYYDLLAVSSYSSENGGYVTFSDKKSGKTLHVSDGRKDCNICLIKWHPMETVLAIAWNSGKVSLINQNTKEEYDVLNDENDLIDITSLEWNLNGKLLFIGDSVGTGIIIELSSNVIELKYSVIDKKIHVDDKIVSVCCRMLKETTKVSSASSIKSNTLLNNIVNENMSKEEIDAIENISRKLRREAIVEVHENINIKEKGINNLSSTPDNQIPVFVIGTISGNIYTYDLHTRNVVKRFHIDSEIVQLLDIPEKSLVLVLTSNFQFFHLTFTTINGNELFKEKLKVKLTGKKGSLKMIRLIKGVIAISFGEGEIRIWDVINEDSALFKLSKDKGYDTNESIIDMIFNLKKECLLASTTGGKIASWIRKKSESTQLIDKEWKLQSAINTGGGIKSISTSNATNALAVISSNNITIFQDESLLYGVSSSIIAVQNNQNSLSVVKITYPEEIQEIFVKLKFKNIYISNSYGIIIWENKTLILLSINYSNTDSPMRIEQVGIINLPESPKDIILYKDAIYCIEGNKLNIRTLQGTVKKTISFREMEGDPLKMEVGYEKWLLVSTIKGYIKVYDLEDIKLKEYHQPKCISKEIPFFEKINCMKINKEGSKIAITCQQISGEIYEKIFIWDAEVDSLNYFSFAFGITDQQQYDVEEDIQQRAKTSRPKTTAAKKIEQEQSRFRLPYHTPGNIVWDINDSRLLMCEAKSINAEDQNTFLISMFVTSDHGIQMQDIVPFSPRAGSLILLNVPYVYYLKNLEVDDSEYDILETTISKNILRITLREFVGLERSDKKSIEAMLNFSFFLTIGQMDKAFKAIQFIKSESVWEHMAKMCVKNRRLDVAAVCLGNMGHAMGAKALREIMSTDAVEEVKVAMLAIQLGMLIEAENLYIECKRYDLLNKLYQTENRWAEAFDIAQTHDRINLKNTHYNYAKYLETKSDITNAMTHYEKSGNIGTEIPRLLLSEPKALELYIKRKRDPKLLSWWGQYLETQGKQEMAITYYEQGGSYKDVVRILIDNDDIEKAIECVDLSKDNSSAFVLAKYFEENELYREAVEYFTKAKAFGNAIRLAKEHQMNDKMANLALYAGETQILETAKYYEDIPGEADKAVMLYHRLGMIGKALDLAFETEQFGVLDLIANELNEKSDPKILVRAAEFYSANQDDKKAVQLLAHAKKFSEAVQLCRKNNVMITEEIANLLTVTKEQIPNNEQRKRLLEEVAECCLEQGNYHHAAKKYTQAGNTLFAMKALLKSGDTPKIIKFANTARNKNIFKLAGNYLQTLNWKEDATLMRQIETCYTKAGAYDSLSIFYETCGYVEIDEYKDYEKGLAAFNEAGRCITKALEVSDKNKSYIEEKQMELVEKINNIKIFLKTNQLYDSDPGNALRQLIELADKSNIDDSVRLGDIYTILTLHNYKRKNYKKAYDFIQELLKKKKDIKLNSYITEDVLNQICDELKVPRLIKKDSDDKLSDDEEDEKGIDYSHAMKRNMDAQQNSDDDDDVDF
uniref:ANAPC4_WD40 domain-containing protein n=1 Tax=Parastrongyloides trichosuri TaxID=131310 RepID=A0A0N4ZH95_PARTI